MGKWALLTLRWEIIFFFKVEQNKLIQASVLKVLVYHHPEIHIAMLHQLEHEISYVSGSRKVFLSFFKLKKYIDLAHQHIFAKVLLEGWQWNYRRCVYHNFTDKDIIFSHI